MALEEASVKKNSTRDVFHEMSALVDIQRTDIVPRITVKYFLHWLEEGLCMAVFGSHPYTKGINL